MKIEDAIKSNKFQSEVHKATLNIFYTSWWLKTIVSTVLKQYGLTHEQFNVLRILKGKHPEHHCVREISNRMIEKSSNVPRIIDRLEVKKFVKRITSATDKRETEIQLTQAGINILEITVKKVNESMDKYIDIPEKDAMLLNKLLEKLRNAEK